MKPVRTAVIPAGGLGTRFLPFSRSVPKELLPLVDTPVLDAVVSECAASGIERVVLVVAPGKESLASYFGPSPRTEARLRDEGRGAELEALRRPERLAKIDGRTGGAWGPIVISWHLRHGRVLTGFAAHRSRVCIHDDSAYSARLGFTTLMQSA